MHPVSVYVAVGATHLLHRRALLEEEFVPLASSCVVVNVTLLLDRDASLEEWFAVLTSTRVVVSATIPLHKHVIHDHQLGFEKKNIYYVTCLTIH